MATNTECEQDFGARTNHFLQWLQQLSGTSINPKMRIADLREQNAGRGIVAEVDIEEDEELFSIAQSDVLTIHNSNLQRVKPTILEHLDAWNSLVLVMIYEDSLGESSNWWPYLSILPKEFDTLMYWSSDELAELQGSAVLHKIGKRDADESFKKCLLPLVKQYPTLFGHHAHTFGGVDAETAFLKIAHRMATLIMAYGFDLVPESSSEVGEEDEADGSSQSAYQLNKGMVPLADLFNADGDLNNAHLVQHGNTMTMITLKDIPKGQQIFNDFGQLPSSDLLRRYGYVTDMYKKWDVVEVDIAIVTKIAGEYNKLSDGEREDRVLLAKLNINMQMTDWKQLDLAAEWEVLQDGYDLNRPLGNRNFEFDRELLLTITALLLDSKNFKEASEKPPEQPPSFLLIPLALVLRRIIFTRQGAYKTTIAEDTTLLEDPRIQGRQKMAIKVRLGEKQILAIAADEAEKRIAKLGDTTKEEQEAGQVKRTKF